MFFTYLFKELRRRTKQSSLIMMGLGVGIALVIVVSAVSSGVHTAESSELTSLYGVGTDMTITKAGTPGNGGFHIHNFHPPGTTSATSTQKTSTAKITRNSLHVSPGVTTLPASDVAKASAQKGVSFAVGGLSLMETSLNGQIPSTRPVYHRGTSSGGGFSFTGPGATFNITTFSVDGVQLSASGYGPLSQTKITKGTFFSSSDGTKDVAIVSASYAKQKKLSVGSTIKIGSTKFDVIGIATSTTSSSDVFIPLAEAQSLAKLKNKVSTIYVGATSATNVSGVAATLRKALSGATVTTAGELANAVSGSVKTASNLANNVGKWLSILALIGAIAIAGLLMMASVSRRVREIGTLKAIGWRSSRVVRQIMGEGLFLGVLGGVVGIGLGAIGAAIVTAISPTLSASAGSPGSLSGGFGSPGGGFHNPGGTTGGTRSFSGAPNGGKNPFGNHGLHQVLLHLNAPLQLGVIGLAIGLAVGAGLLAGGFGALRASKLRPATALRSVE